jgi:flagellar biosynthetic protein FliQ
MVTGELVELARQAALDGFVTLLPALAVGLAVGLVVGFVQAATGIQEPIVGFVPRLAAMAIIVALTLPWIVERFVDLVRVSVSGP